MIPPYSYRYHIKKLIELENEETTEPHARGLIRWLTPPFRDEAPSLCQACRNRKLDFRPLMKKLPKLPSNYPHDSVEDDDLEDLEKKNAVYINDFLLEEAVATKSQCSLCRLLVGSLYRIFEEGWRLLRMRCACIIRPRYDWLGSARKRSLCRERLEIVHRYQIFIQFEPIESELVLDLVCLKKSEFVGKARLAIPATVDIKLLGDWIQQCDEKHNHPAIPGALISRMQVIIHRGLFRVINTSTGVVEVQTSLPRFVALSYVWGSTTNQLDHQPLKSKPILAHAPSIRDAAVIACSLGFKWLWVDRVCIDQSSESEKAILIPYMKDIFAAAQLTIVAARGDGAQSGFLHPRKVEKPLVFNSSVSVLSVAQDLETLLKDSIWGGRGWTFEEYVFSRRLLFFLESEVFFKCGAHTFRESLGLHPIREVRPTVSRGISDDPWVSHTEGLHKSLHNKPDNLSKALNGDIFIHALEAYSKRSLSFEEDRVAAFGGVILAAATGPMVEISERELLRHGHPLHLFEILLAWEHGYSGTSSARPIPDKPFAPSWSWASSPVSITFSEFPHNRLIHRLDHPWFRYTLLHNHDILGLPTNNNLLTDMPYIVGQTLPDGLIADQLSNKLPLGHEARQIHNLLPLPSIHMVTLVFDARFVCCEEKAILGPEFVLVPLDSTETSEEVRSRTGSKHMSNIKPWSLHPDIASRYVSEPVISRPRPFETFALITGYDYPVSAGYGCHGPTEIVFSLFIMLLDSSGENSTYKRAGMACISGVSIGSDTTEVIKRGRPRWQYIRII
ncbi:heterokaryon incompatibility protein-domain-containing protein [Xylaria telfairii]|nr:heterokaryon incompatibility protein-domain-containing protein [Xylaria telfairii]